MNTVIFQVACLLTKYNKMKIIIPIIIAIKNVNKFSKQKLYLYESIIQKIILNKLIRHSKFFFINKTEEKT